MGGRFASLWAEIGVDATKLVSGLRAAKTQLTDAQGDLQKLSDAATRNGADFRNLGGIADDWVGKLRASTPQNAAFAKQIGDITENFQSGKISSQEAAAQIQNVQAQMMASLPAMERYKAQFSKIQAQIIPAVGILAGFGVAVKGAYDAAKEGAALEFSAQKFDRLAASVGATSDALLGDLRKATRGTVDDMTLMGSAGDFMALGLAKSRDEVVRLTRVAGALGMDMNQLVLTLANQTTMRFDQLGVSVDGFDEKVAALKKTGMDANAAFTEAFLQQAEAQIEKVGDNADTAAGQMAILETNFTNLSNEMKMRFVPAASNVVTALDKIFFGQRDINAAWKEHEGVMRGEAKSYAEYVGEMERAAKAAGLWNIDMTTAELYGMGAAEDEARAQLNLLNEEQWVAENRARVFAEAVADTDLA